MNFEKYVISFIITSLIFNSEKLLSLEILNPVGFFFFALYETEKCRQRTDFVKKFYITQERKYYENQNNPKVKIDIFKGPSPFEEGINPRQS